METETPKKRSASKSLLIVGGAVVVLFAASVAFNPYCPLRGGAAGRVPQGEQAPNFVLQDLGGETVDFRQATDGKAVVLKFGALWCGWCQRQSEEFRTLQEQLDPDRAVIFEVSVQGDEPVDKVREKQEDLGLRHTVVRDADNEAVGKYGVSGIPAVFVVAPDGGIVYRAHFTPTEKLLEEVEKALAAAGPEG